MERRILALWFPRLATDRLHRRWKAQKACTPSAAPAEQAPAEQAKHAADKIPAGMPPLVLVAKIDNALRLCAVDRKASACGLRAGMTLADARAMMPALKIVPANEPADRKLLERIADWCDRFTPFVALDPPRMLLLDVTGAAHLFSGEAALLDLIRSKLAGQSFAVRAAIAGTMLAARALARHADGTIAPPKGDAAFIAPLPIEALALDHATTHAFRRAGLKTIGQVAERKRSELTLRFGAATLFAFDHALGRAEKPISPRIPLPDYRTEHRFADPVATEAVMLATLKSLAQSLAATMAEHDEGARQLEAAFFRSDGIVRRLAIDMAAPTRDADIIERLFKEKIAALSDPLDPGFGYDVIRLCASRTERKQAKTENFDSGSERAGSEQDRDIRFLIDRLAARFGSQAILSFTPGDTHIPEAAGIACPAQYARCDGGTWKKIRESGEAPRRPLRLFEKPEAIEVTAAVPEGPPLQFRWRRVLHAVAMAEGPERIAMEWWRQGRNPRTRDYFRVEDSEGRRYWVYRDGIHERETSAPRWFMHGVFA